MGANTVWKVKFVDMQEPGSDVTITCDTVILNSDGDYEFETGSDLFAIIPRNNVRSIRRERNGT